MNKYILFKNITETIFRRYILFEEKNINWNNISNQYFKFLNNIKNDAGFVDLVNKMILELKDAHVNFSKLASTASYFLPINFKFIQNHLISTSNEDVLPKGAEILEIDNYKISNLFSAEINSLSKMRFLNDIYSRPGKESMCKYFWNGKKFDIKLKNVSIEQNLVLAKETISEDILVGLFSKKIDSEIEYIKITSFNHGIAKAFFKAVQKIGSRKKIIIDLRGTKGGYIKETIDSVALFAKYEIYLGKKTYISNKEKTTENVIIKPIKTNSKFEKILILIDNFTMSSSEFIFLRAIKKIKNVTLIGEKTAGIVHGTTRFVFDKSYLLNLTTCKYYDEKNFLLKDTGIDPNIYITETINSIINNIDCVLDFAIKN
ncbi:MAG: S41 family peptidase [Oscillospiraceae bacterium]|jgi:C-terminal processing protease CtpA/Prc|nr:S41 family peptidase [Oscillospiraceae bacterium]